MLGRLSCQNTLALFKRVVEGNATYGGLAEFFDLILRLRGAVPVGIDKTGMIVEQVHKFFPGIRLMRCLLYTSDAADFPGIRLMRVVFLELKGFFKEILLYFLE